MLKKTVTYTDYNGIERTEDFYFNLTKAECIEMNLSTPGGLDGFLDKIIKTNDTPAIIKQFKDLVLLAYGEKSDDGRRFMKTEEIKRGFSETEAYSIIFMELASNAKSATEFVNGIIPADIVASVKKDEENKEA